MDKELEKYRNQKRRQDIFNRIKDRLISMVSFPRVHGYKKEESISFTIPDVVNDDSNESENSDNLDANIDYPSSDENNSNDSKVQNTVAPKEPISRLTYFTYTVYFCFWTTCWLIAIELKFGIVFLLFSALFGIYFNTRTGPKPRNEISAYSVFNENCESIDGTLTAEQFEREIRYGPMTVK